MRSRTPLNLIFVRAATQKWYVSMEFIIKFCNSIWLNLNVNVVYLFQIHFKLVNASFAYIRLQSNKTNEKWKKRNFLWVDGVSSDKWHGMFIQMQMVLGIVRFGLQTISHRPLNWIKYYLWLFQFLMVAAHYSFWNPHFWIGGCQGRLDSTHLLARSLTLLMRDNSFKVHHYRVTSVRFNRCMKQK